MDLSDASSNKFSEEAKANFLSKKKNKKEVKMVCVCNSDSIHGEETQF